MSLLLYLLYTLRLSLLIGLFGVRRGQAWRGIPTMTSEFNNTMGSAQPRTYLKPGSMNFFFPSLKLVVFVSNFG